MEDKFGEVARVAIENDKNSLEVLKQLTDVAQPEAVFSKPVKIGDTQVITASEVQVGLGYGYGFGRGPRIISNLPEGEPESEGETGMGGAGGGGGGSGGRPVAVITIREDGVEVEPILDFTKIALAFFTMLGSVFFMGAQMRKGK